MTVYRCLAAEITGWGVVGAEYPVESASSNGTTITVRFVTTSDATNFAGQLGADIRLCGSGVFPDRYTLLAQTSTLITLADDVDVARADAGSILACVEDPYRACNEIPDWVVDAAPRARWHSVVSDVPPTLGASVPRTGGIGVVDRVSVQILVDESQPALCDLWRTEGVAWANDGRTCALANPISAGSTSNVIDLVLGVTLSAGYHLAYIDEEAISVWATSTGTHTQLVARRGVLGTQVAAHPSGAIVFSTPPTYIGARAEVAVYESDSSDRFDSIYSIDAILDAPTYDAGTAAYTLPLRSELLTAYAGGVASRMTVAARWDGASLLISQRDPYQAWRWVDVGGIAYRLLPTPTFTENPATGDIEREYFIDCWRGPANPIILDTSLPVDDVLRALGYFSGYGVAGINFPVEESDGYTFRATTIPILDVIARGDPMPCAIISAELDTYATVPFATNEPGDTRSKGFAYTSPLAAILAVLCSTGAGNNRGELDSYWGGYFGTVDYLPQDVGLGIPQSRIFTESFRPGYIKRALPNIGGLALSAEDSRDPAKWLEEKILKPLFLALAPTRSGKIALIDLATVPDLDTADPLDMGAALRGPAGSVLPTVSVRWDGSGIVTGVRAAWHRTSDVPPGETVAEGTSVGPYGTINRVRSVYDWSVSTRVSVVVRGDQSDGGSTYIMRRISGGVLDFDPGWIVDDNELVDAFRQAATAYMQQQGIPRLAIDALIADRDSYADIELGSIVLVSNCPIPGSDGTRGLEAYARVYGIRRNLLNATQSLSMLVIGRTPQQARWVASGIVTTVASATSIGIALDAYAVTGGRVETDAPAFRVGDRVMLVSATFEIRCTNAPEVTAIDTGTSTLTIDAGFDDGAPVTPDAGDIVIVAPRSNQALAASESTRGWLDYSTTGLTAAERTRWQ